LPRGTHEYDRLLKPSEVARFARAAGLDVADISGLAYDPVREQSSLTRDPSVNYLMHLTRSAAAGRA
jgi:2-polyprenyl-6-hydroxyphenyl methylase/3-demethylubiquinone-9 3-methyltransferase